MKNLQKYMPLLAGSVFLCAFLVVDVRSAFGALSAWRSRSVGYVAMEQPLKVVLEELGYQLGVPVQAGRGVEGKITKRRYEGYAPKVLDEIAREYNLIWYSDGGVVYMERSDESVTQVFKVSGAPKDKINNALDQFDLINARDRIQVSDDGTFVRVTGPETLSKLVETALSTLEGAGNLNLEIIRFGKKYEE